MSTSDAHHTRDMAARLRDACGLGWLDAPISGGAPAALEGRMAVMVGGAEAEFERARPVWDALAGRCTLMGPNGAGQTTKMINQILVSCTSAATGISDIAPPGYCPPDARYSGPPAFPSINLVGCRPIACTGPQAGRRATARFRSGWERIGVRPSPRSSRTRSSMDEISFSKRVAQRPMKLTIWASLPPIP
ncbi:MAG: NAD(P)-dependent oxidoreductase [Deltaproteobacteria bacterium]|nr:NAD(P)-dependent oxidoreductase [Deltaproteobacteria bacterium]